MRVRELYAELRALGQEHIAARQGQNYGPHGRLWGPHRMEAAVEGEIALAMYFGSVPDFNRYQYGDGGADVWVLLRMNSGEHKFLRINVKGVWNWPHYLLVGAREPGVEHYIVDPDTIYAQAYRPHGQDENENNIDLGPWPLNGWMLGSAVEKYPKDDFNKGGRIVHKVPSWEPNLLRPMSMLRRRYLHQWRRNLQAPVQQATYCDDD